MNQSFRDTSESCGSLRVLTGMYADIYGCAPAVIVPVSAEGSSRRYWRLSAPNCQSLIGCHDPDTAENQAFFYIADILGKAGVNVPKVVASSDSGTEYLQTDLGTESLFGIIKSYGVESPYVTRIATETMRQLAIMHYAGGTTVDFSKCYPRPAMDARAVMWDLNYFKYCFLKLSSATTDEDRLQNDFERLASIITSNTETVLIMRDCQSRNIMIRDSAPWLIDFQGARRGPAAYDIASFAWQARAGFSPAQRHDIVQAYIKAARQYPDFNEHKFYNSLPICILLRMLQVLGAYGFRGYIERKSAFITPVPHALALLSELMCQHDFPELPYLAKVLRQLIEDPVFAPEAPRTRLIVEISSFSYKKGIPADNSGNGGGFVFDCRAIHNPGRYEQYRKLTGRDRDVIEFLESQSEMPQYMEQIYRITSLSVEKYIQRGFTHLCVHFGCTGGQHRSVYAAQHLAEYLSSKYGVEVHLKHREQSLTQIFPPK